MLGVFKKWLVIFTTQTQFMESKPFQGRNKLDNLSAISNYWLNQWHTSSEIRYKGSRCFSIFYLAIKSKIVFIYFQQKFGCFLYKFFLFMTKNTLANILQISEFFVFRVNWLIISRKALKNYKQKCFFRFQNQLIPLSHYSWIFSV